MILNEQEGKLEIEYPCNWKYKLICKEASKVIDAIERIVVDFKYDLTPSNISLKGKYVSLNLSVLVNNNTERLSIYTLLYEEPDILYIL
jgi:putative lipoic acid-binding regulatory protein